MVREIVRLMEIILFSVIFGPVEGTGPNSYAIFEGNEG